MWIGYYRNCAGINPNTRRRPSGVWMTSLARRSCEPLQRCNERTSTKSIKSGKRRKNKTKNLKIQEKQTKKNPRKIKNKRKKNSRNIFPYYKYLTTFFLIDRISKCFLKKQGVECNRKSVHPICQINQLTIGSLGGSESPKNAYNFLKSLQFSKISTIF